MKKKGKLACPSRQVQAHSCTHIYRQQVEAQGVGAGNSRTAFCKSSFGDGHLVQQQFKRDLGCLPPF